MTFPKFVKTIALLLAFPCALLAQKSEASFKKECAAIVSAFARQDYKALNKYIDNATGVYVITRPGAIDALHHYDSLSNQAFSFYPYKETKPSKSLSVKFGPAPKFNCGDMKWNKTGFYADTARDNRLSELIDFLSKNQMGNYGEAELSKAKELEGKSRKVVYTELAKKHGVVFYLTLINKKWHLTLVDAVAGDCSA